MVEGFIGLIYSYFEKKKKKVVNVGKFRVEIAATGCCDAAKLNGELVPSTILQTCSLVHDRER